ncbi:MAG: SUMF1/EgtB/PvdO family nonheme iron enzyme [Sandaracinaceae bacterium]|nr:SUMF1/EgtB/PvdO family nonheme iron enzyme [Sandaracinaceae bacterium]
MGQGAPEYTELTPHEESVGAFCMDRTEVTAGAYAACTSEACQGVDQQGWCADAEEHVEHPRNCVSWQQASAYCAWRGARLPSDAEWEYAARGTDGRLFPWGNEPPDETRARWNNAFTESERWSRMRSSPVGSYPGGASPFGVLDMAGNVSEWVGTSTETPDGTRYFVRGGLHEHDSRVHCRYAPQYDRRESGPHRRLPLCIHAVATLTQEARPEDAR